MRFHGVIGVRRVVAGAELSEGNLGISRLGRRRRRLAMVAELAGGGDGSLEGERICWKSKNCLTNS